MSNDRIRAPWTPAQVDALNRWQRLGHAHPFTCPVRGGADHGEEPLVATHLGWQCPYCTYEQPWAFDFMADVGQHPVYPPPDEASPPEPPPEPPVDHLPHVTKVMQEIATEMRGLRFDLRQMRRGVRR